MFIRYISMTMCIFSLFLSGCDPKDRTVTVSIKNDSENLIKTIKVSIYEEPYVINDLKPGEEHIFNYAIRSETSYDIEWIDHAGSHVARNVGYVTRGMNKHDEISIGDNGIKFSIKEFYPP